MIRRKSRQKEVQTHITSYCGKVTECLRRFEETFLEACADFDRDAVRRGYERVHEAEGRADDIRRELESLMYSKSVFPESRGDILELIEAVDRVPNSAESAVRMVFTQHIELPGTICEPLSRLVEIARRCVETMVKGVEQLFTNYLDAAITVGKINKFESESDRVEFELVERVFASDAGDLQKLLLRDLVNKIGSISDRSESVGDRIRIMLAKRTV